VNVRLLRELQREPRLAMSALARRVRMSAPAVTERVRRLEEAGVIAGYRMEIAPGALGLPLAAYVRIRPAPGQLPRVADLAQRTPEVVECHRITGEDCFLLKVHVADVDGLEGVLDRFLAFGQTTTSIVQSTPVPPRSLPLPADRLEREHPLRARHGRRELRFAGSKVGRRPPEDAGATKEADSR
jgi:Lrp/AsnC family leucine-responsive transcriptional regulator